MAATLTALVLLETFLTGYMLRHIYALQGVVKELAGQVQVLEHDFGRMADIVEAIRE